MRIIFMGTPEFAVPCLERLIQDGHEVSGVFTQPDKPKGRGYSVMPPPVKQAALKAGIPVYQPASVKTEAAFAQLKALDPELIVVVAYGKILPQAVLDLPPYGCINVHASLLPRLRGAAPIQWSILRGDQKTGVTTMFMDAGLDTGDMLLKAETEIGEDETAGELHDKLSGRSFYPIRFTPFRLARSSGFHRRTANRPMRRCSINPSARLTGQSPRGKFTIKFAACPPGRWLLQACPASG